MKDTLPEEQTPSWWCLGFRWRDFPNNSHLSLYLNLLQTLFGRLPVIKTKVCYLKSCVTGRLYLGCLCTIVPEYSFTITRTFAINSVIVVSISHLLSAIYFNSIESSGGTSGCNGGIFLKIHNFHWIHTLHKRWKYGCDRYVTKSSYMMKNITSDCILPSIAGVLLKIHICHFNSFR